MFEKYFNKLSLVDKNNGHNMMLPLNIISLVGDPYQVIYLLTITRAVVPLFPGAN